MFKNKNEKKADEEQKQNVFSCKTDRTESGSSTRSKSPTVPGCHILDFAKNEAESIRPSSWDESDDDLTIKSTHTRTQNVYSPVLINREDEKDDEENIFEKLEKKDTCTILNGTDRRQSPARIRRRTKSCNSPQAKENNILQLAVYDIESEDTEINNMNVAYSESNVNAVISSDRKLQDELTLLKNTKNSEPQDLEQRNENVEEDEDGYCRTFRKLSQILEVDEIKKDSEDIVSKGLIQQMEKKYKKIKRDEKSFKDNANAENQFSFSNFSFASEKPNKATRKEINLSSRSEITSGGSLKKKLMDIDNSTENLISSTSQVKSVENLSESKIFFNFNKDDKDKDNCDKTNFVVISSKREKEESADEKGKGYLNCKFFQCGIPTKSSEKLNRSEKLVNTDLIPLNKALDSKDSIGLDLPKNFHSAKSTPRKKIERSTRSFRSFSGDKTNKSEVNYKQESPKFIIPLGSARSFNVEDEETSNTEKQHEKAKLSSRTKLSAASEDCFSKRSIDFSVLSYPSAESLGSKSTVERNLFSQKISPDGSYENSSPSLKSFQTLKISPSTKTKTPENFNIQNVEFSSKFSPTKSRNDFFRNPEESARTSASDPCSSRRGSKASPGSSYETTLNFGKTCSGLWLTKDPRDNKNYQKLFQETLEMEVLTRLENLSLGLKDSSKCINPKLETIESFSNESFKPKNSPLSEKHVPDNEISKFVRNDSDQRLESKNYFPPSLNFTSLNSPTLLEAASEEILNFNFNENINYLQDTFEQAAIEKEINQDSTSIFSPGKNSHSKMSFQHENETSGSSFKKPQSFEENIESFNESIPRKKSSASEKIFSFEEIKNVKGSLFPGDEDESTRNSERTRSGESPEDKKNPGDAFHGGVWEDLIEEFDGTQSSSGGFSSNNFPGFSFRKNFPDESFPGSTKRNREKNKEMEGKKGRKLTKPKNQFNFEELSRKSKVQSQKKFKPGFDTSEKKENDKSQPNHLSTPKAYFFNLEERPFFPIGESGDVNPWNLDPSESEKPKDHGDGNSIHGQNWENFLKIQSLDNKAEHFFKSTCRTQDISTVELMKANGGKSKDILETEIHFNDLRTSKSDNCIHTKEARSGKFLQEQEKNCDIQINYEMSKPRKRKRASKTTPKKFLENSDSRCGLVLQERFSSSKSEIQGLEEDENNKMILGLRRASNTVTDEAAGLAIFQARAQNNPSPPRKNNWLVIGPRTKQKRRKKLNKHKRSFEVFPNGRDSPASSRTPVTPLKLKSPGCWQNFYKRVIKVFCFTPDSSVTTTD